MKKNDFVIFALIAIALLVGFSIYNGLIIKRSTVKTTAESKEKKEILYWTCGMHPAVKQDKPGNCPICNMALIPVYKEAEQPPVSSTGNTAQQSVEAKEYYGCGVKEEGHCPHCDEGIKDAKCICGGHSLVVEGKEIQTCPICKKPLKKIETADLPKDITKKPEKKKIIFYRNPMNPAVTSSVPAKDEMGMDYIPVYEEAPQGSALGSEAISRIHLSQNQLQLAGVGAEPLMSRRLYKQIRTVGKIAFDPELAVAQEEFLTALETKEKVAHSPDLDVIGRAQDIVDKSKFRLRLLGMSDEEIAQLEKDKTTQLNLVLPEDKAWVYADIYEYDLVWVKETKSVKVTTTAYPGDIYEGIIKSISPVLNPMTRTATVRLEINNLDKKLKPQMYVDVIIESVYRDSEGKEEVLAVPRDAVLDTGMRKIVYVDTGGGTFIGKDIKIGPHANAIVNGEEQSFYPVLSGLSRGEIVVTKGNFLIDSQSQISGTQAAAYGGALGTQEEAKPPIHQH